MKIAIIGTGAVARGNYLPFLAKQQDVSLSYYSRTREKADACARDFGGRVVGSMQELRDAKVDLFIHQQGLDTTTASGRAMFGMLGVFSEFERAMIQAWVKAGLERAKQEQMAGKVRRDARGRRLKAIGRPPRVSSATEAAIRERLAAGVGMLTIAAQLGVGSGTVQRVKRVKRVKRELVA